VTRELASSPPEGEEYALRRAGRYLLALARLTSENQCRCADHIYTASDTYSDFNANTNSHSYGNGDPDSDTHTDCNPNCNTRPSDCHY
jgi:hypothetical protein